MKNYKQTPTVGDLLHNTPLPTLEAQLLLASALAWTRTQLITRSEQAIAQADLEAFYALEKQRLEGMPIAYLLGYREFFGLEFHVTPDVLIPRPETEGLVECAIETLQDRRHARVLELGTGSGAIAIAIAHQCPSVEVVATDRCPNALEIAKANAKRLLAANRPAGALLFLQGDWYGALTDAPACSMALNDEQPTIEQYGRFDVIVSNPPYLALNDPHRTQGDLRFEPLGALTEGADGLQALYALIEGAPERLKAGGSIWLEHGYDQAAAVRTALQNKGAVHVRSVCDLARIERITGGVFL